jgi:hypothetical protein
MSSVFAKKTTDTSQNHSQSAIHDVDFSVEIKKDLCQIRKNTTNRQNNTDNDNRVITKSPAEVLQAFNTWAFKREQPDTPELILAQLTAAMAAGQPLRFVLYWGKGPRHTMGAPEETCLDFLASMTKRISASYASGAEFMLICTDTHARLNGHKAADIDAYFAAVAKAAGTRGFSSCRLGDLLDQYDPLALHAFEGELRSDPIFQKLVKSASKWYSGSDDVEDGAETYYRMNLREKHAVEMAFPDSLFVTFNGHDFRRLFPDKLPVFYMYSTKRGCSVKPWFVAETSAP